MEPALPDYYAVLQVAPSATPDEIRAAHRERLKENHPDITRGLWERHKNSDDPVLLKLLEQKVSAAHTTTQQINAAYQVLSDPTRRARYDRQRQTPPPESPAPPPQPPPRAQPAPHTTIFVTSPTAAELQRLEEERLINQVIALCIHGRYPAALALAEAIPTPDRRRRVQAFVQDLRQPRRSAPAADLAPSDTACPHCKALLQPAHQDLRLRQAVGPLLRRSRLEAWAAAASLPLLCLLLVALCAVCSGVMLSPANTTLSQRMDPPAEPRAAGARPTLIRGGAAPVRWTPILLPALFSGLAPAGIVCLLSTGVFLMLLYQLPPVRAGRQQRRQVRQVWARTRACPQCRLVFIGGAGQGIHPAEMAGVLEAHSLS